MLTKFFAMPFLKFWSYLYRVMLVFIATSLLSANDFTSVGRIIAFICLGTWCIAMYWIKRHHEWPIIRMALDYSLIITTLVLSQAPDKYKLAFILLPILNQHNHSATHRSKRRTIIYMSLWTGTFIIIHPGISWFTILLYTFVMLIILVDWVNCAIKRLSDDLEVITYEIIDSSEESSGVTDTLKKILTIIQNKLPNIFPAKEIYLLELDGASYRPRAGTVFKPDLRFSLVDSSNHKNKILVTCRSNSDEDERTRVFKGITIDYNKKKYIFVIALTKPLRLEFFTDLIGYQIFHKSTLNIVRLYARKRESKLLRKVVIDEFIVNSQYINSVRAAAHFIKNNINPFVTINEMLTEYLDESNKEETVDKADLRNTNAKLKQTRLKISEYVQKILDAPKKDIFSEEAEPVNPIRIMKTIYEYIELNAPNAEFRIHQESKQFEQQVFMWKQVNFSVLIENIIKNAAKHSIGNASIDLMISETSLQLSVTNRIKKTESQSACTFVSDINSSTRDEIITRKGEGLWLIKTCSANLGCKVSAEILSQSESLCVTVIMEGGI